MTKEELIDKIEALIIEYFEDNEDEEEVSEVYTLQDPDGTYISVDFTFDKH